MARIKDESVERVKAAMEILPLVEDVVRLRKAGSTYKGLCPFHQERTPSFTVSPARGTYKCFGCGEGGDAISFVEKTENVDFVGAIELLARRFGVELEYEEASPEQEQRRRREDRLRALLERAAEFYARVLWESEAAAGARNYLASRGLGEEVCREFRLGYAPGAARLAARALQEGYTQEELLAVGLANRRGNDYFQRRIVFPLADARGRVRGFQARKLHDDDPLQAKYVNSPEGELFRKGDLLYGLDGARQAIAREDRAVVVEGNTDVIALRQAGFAPVVASMGTALTEAQLRELARLTKRLYLCFDSDAAGQDATLRGMELAVRDGFSVRVVPLPPGTDPADDPAAFQERLAKPVSYPVHRVRLEHARASDPQAAFAAIRTFLGSLPDSPEHLEARRVAADLLDLPPETQAGLAPARGGARTAGVVSPRLLDVGQRLERSALAGVAAHESLLPDLELLGPEHFDDELHRRARAYLLGEEATDGELTALLAELYALPDEEEITLETASQLLLRLRERGLQRELAAADDSRLVELQQALAKLRDEIRTFA
ncbi:MAG TPA: DNA primase [Gaiellaceae bacterium]|nr:DNA primase [Gaiellaceae bacterium]